MKEEDFWHFLMRIPETLEAQIFVALMLSGVVGMLANWLVRWTRGDVGCLVAYLWRDSFRSTLLSVFTFIGTVLTALMSGVFVEQGQFVGWFNVLWMGATTGFGVDAVVNKGKREVWDEATRKEKLGD